MHIDPLCACALPRVASNRYQLNTQNPKSAKNVPANNCHLKVSKVEDWNISQIECITHTYGV